MGKCTQKITQFSFFIYFKNSIITKFNTTKNYYFYFSMYKIKFYNNTFFIELTKVVKMINTCSL